MGDGDPRFRLDRLFGYADFRAFILETEKPEYMCLLGMFVNPMGKE
jgi:hypothetical protein